MIRGLGGEINHSLKECSTKTNNIEEKIIAEKISDFLIQKGLINSLFLYQKTKEESKNFVTNIIPFLQIFKTKGKYNIFFIYKYIIEDINGKNINTN